MKKPEWLGKLDIMRILLTLTKELIAVLGTYLRQVGECDNKYKSLLYAYCKYCSEV